MDQLSVILSKVPENILNELANYYAKLDHDPNEHFQEKVYSKEEAKQEITRFVRSFKQPAMM